MITINDQLTLVPITLANAHTIYPLMQAAYPSSYEHYWNDGGEWYMQYSFGKERILRDIETPDTWYWKVQYNQVDCGILRIIHNCPAPNEVEQRGVKLNRIYLYPGVQGKGIGQQLLSFVHHRAKVFQHKYVWLEVMDQQHAALQFYQKMGYEVTTSLSLDFERLYVPMRGMLRMVKWF